jgi:uncharacterized membrane protein YbhN (UPF0104 family)
MTELARRVRAKVSPRARRWLSIVATVAVCAGLCAALAGQRDEFVRALHLATLGLLAGVAALHVVSLLGRSEAWLRCIRAAGGCISRRVIFRASSMSFAGGLLTGQLATAARIAALRKAAPADAPRIPAMIAAELPIVAVEGALGALTSWTLIGPLGLPWFTPLAVLLVIGALTFALRRGAARRGREFWKGLAVLHHPRGAVFLVAFTLVCVVGQVLRNFLVLRALGVDVTIFDAMAVLIVVSVLGQLPMGPSVGAAAAVIILGRHGVGTVAAAGVLLTATGTAGALLFAVWGVLDHAVATRLQGGRAPAAGAAVHEVAELAQGSLERRPGIEIAHFGGLAEHGRE